MKFSHVAALLALGLVILAAVIYWPEQSPERKTTNESVAPNTAAEARGASGQAQSDGGSVKTAGELEERRAGERVDAIQSLEGLSDSKTLSVLGKDLGDPNPEVKEAALEALADREGAGVTEIIRRGLGDPDPEFRIEVLEVLADRGDLDSLRRARSDPNEEVRERAAELLETAGP